MSPSFRKYYRFIAIFLSFLLIFTAVAPNIANAAKGEKERIVKKQEIEADIGEMPSKLPKEKLELKRKRTKYSTRYLNPDGSFTEEIYLEPHFYQDPKDKKWKNIDNTLKKKDKKNKVENSANNFNVAFSEESGGTDLVTIEKDGNSISLIPTKNKEKKVKGKIEDNEITYSEIFDQADVRYQMQGNGVKEDIILNDVPSENTFSFELKLKGLTATTDEEGLIIFKDKKGNKQWYFEKPFMTDANGQYSEDVILALKEEKGKIFVDVVADSTFLEDPKTKYPVTIDPTINHWDVLLDTFVATAYPDSVAYSHPSMRTGFDTSYGVTRSLLAFTLPTLPSDSNITNATFHAYQTKTDGITASIDLYRILDDWEAGTTTWNRQPSIDPNPEFTETNNIANGYWEWEITNLANDWYRGDQGNYGFMLVQKNESSTPSRVFNQVNSGNFTPRLTINYTVDPIGFESYWDITEDGVNPVNGNLLFSKIDLDIPGLGVTTEVTRTYNSRKSEKFGMFGYGWWSNLESSLNDSGFGPITFMDKDNTSHIFGQSLDGGYETPNGLYVSFTKNTDGTYTITEVDGTIYQYNTSGKISTITDKNGNKTTYGYNNSGKLSSITDASGRVTTLSYGSNGFVSDITDSANRTTSYKYDELGNLTEVIDPAGYGTTFGYDSTHNITSIKDGRENTTIIVYDEFDRVKSISKPITIEGVVDTSKTDYSYNPDIAVTSVTDGEGNRVDYSYNSNGNIVQITENPLDDQNKAVTTFSYDDKNNLTKVIEPNINKKNGSEAYIYSYDENGNINQFQSPKDTSSFYLYDNENNIIEEQDFNGNISEYEYDEKNNNTESIDPYQQTASQKYQSNGNVEYSTHKMSVADNLLSNPSFERDSDGDNWPDHWTQYTETGTSATYAWEDVSKFGNKSISVSSPEGWAVLYSEMMPYEENENYIASGYVKTEALTGTAILKIDYYTSTGTWLDQTYSYALTGSHDWTRVQTVIDNAPVNTSQIRVTVGTFVGEGKAYFDAIQIEKGTVLGAYNLVENSGFERDSNQDGYLDDWLTSGNFSVNDTLDGTNAYVGENALKLTGEVGKNKYIKQSISLVGDENTPLTLSGWSKQNGADPNGGYYLVQVAIHHKDGTIDWTNSEFFDPTAEGWQHIAAQVNPKKAFDQIDVYYYFYNQTGTAWFDAMRLEVGASHTQLTYDANGNYITNVKSPLGNTVSYGYDKVGNLISFSDAKNQKTTFEYDGRNLLTKVRDTNLNETIYTYDGEGNRTSVTDAKNQVTSYEYNEFNQLSRFVNPLQQITKFEYNKNGDQTKLINPNGDIISYTHNELNRLEKVLYNGIEKWSYGYDPNGNITSVMNPFGTGTTYKYDNDGNLVQSTEKSSNVIDYVYDSNRNITSYSVTAGAKEYSNSFKYNQLDQIIAMERNNNNIIKYVYDERGNIISSKRSNGTYSAIEYDSNNIIHSLVNYDTNGNVIDKYVYSYDENSNLTEVKTNNGNILYQYDSLNRLTKETLTDGAEISYEYDAVGNRTKKILSDGLSTTTTNYTYDSGNQLTDVDGQSYNYDANGNLINNGEKTFIYNENNRLIEVQDNNGTVIATFEYDHLGRRTSMTTSTNEKINFHYQGDKVIYETDENNNIISEYTWDADGNPVTMTKEGVTYYYQINSHGDVISLSDEVGNIVAEYQYDAWGNILSQSGELASVNPYRYASYRYDEVTDIYYLMARYYNPKDGRFLTRDKFLGFEEDPSSLNLYAYVGNNPIMYIDPTGHWRIKVRTVAALLNTALGFAVGGGVGAIQAYIIKKGKKAAKRMFYKTVVSRLKAWGAKKLAFAVGAAVAFALNYADVGGAIARYLDKKDKKPRNGYIDF
ncbi:DNRLRE domain-containing protein [Bacillus sp. SCS-151]|uniref:DNRLRE domain-containing protein n=1 Tax=Nanhaiella sioensis TaxID=3115293 RepID=UPI00397CE842